MKAVFSFLGFLILTTWSFAQDSLNNKEVFVAPKAERFKEFLVAGLFDYTIPQGNYGARYFNHAGLGAGFYHKTKSDWYIGADAVHIFGDRVKEDDILSNIETSGGYVIGANGQPADIAISLRGWKINFLKVGKMLVPLRFWRANVHSGIVGMIGTGFFQHKYRIIDNSGSVPQLNSEYVKGYDKLTNGVMITPMIGYFYYDREKFINFFVGVEYMYSWTRNQRDWNHIDMGKDDTLYNDRGWVFKVGWFIPLRKRKAADYYYF